jgi:hypothetical protein
VTVIALASAKGSPGVTSTCLALAAVWPRPVLLAECDPSGGDITAGYLQGQSLGAGDLLELALAARRGLAPDDVVDRCVRLTDEVLLLAGLTDPGQGAALAGMWPTIGAAFRALGERCPARDVLVDCGRLGEGAGLVELLAGCDLLALVLRPTLRQIDAARGRIANLRRDLEQGGSAGPVIGLLLTGPGPHSDGEVSRVLGVPLWGALPADPDTAAVLSDGAGRRRGFDRAPLIRAARGVAFCLSGRPEAAPGMPYRVEPAVAQPVGGAG